VTYRNILVQVDETPPSQLRVSTAAALARRCGSLLTGVFITSEFIREFGREELERFLPSDVFDSVLRRRAEEIRQAAVAARSMFEAAAGQAGVTTYWCEIDGDRDEAMVTLARRCDLIVMASSMNAPRGDNRIPAAQVALACGGPVLILPPRGYQTTVGKRVMVAWKDSRESARAVRDAWPVLSTAEEVVVVCITPKGAGAKDPSLLRHLELHGCKARLVVNDRSDAPTSDLIKLEMGKTSSDLLVMGLYGRPRLQELVLGGVSENLLRDLRFPILVSH